MRYATETELDAELLRDVLALTHPDGHPPERHALATRVTAALTALQPHVLPRRPPPEPVARDVSVGVPRGESPKPVTDRYPCDSCQYLWPGIYCATCREKYEAVQQRAKDRRNARRREVRAMRRMYGFFGKCAVCGRSFKPTRRDQHYCKPACRQKAYRQRQESAA